MAKNSIREYSSTPASNTDIAGTGTLGINDVRNFDDALRTLMAHLADMNAGTSPIDDTFSICDPADATKKFRIDVGSITTATTRTLTVPNASGTLPLLEAQNQFTAINTFLQSPNVVIQKSGITRALMTKVEEGAISLTDFGAVGSNASVDTLAFQTAISTLQTLDIDTTLWIPEGSFEINTQLTIARTTGKSRINVRGYGSKLSQLYFVAANQASEYPMLVFQGGTWGGDETDAALTIDGLTVRTWGGTNHGGLLLDKLIGVNLNDVEFMNFAYHMRLRDIVVAAFRRCRFLYGSRGITAAPGAGAPLNGSAPNEMHFDTCSWIANGAYGIDMTGSGNVKITSGSFEGCGNDSVNFTAAQRYAAKYNDMGYNAAGIVTYDTVHHEGNEGTADVWINHNTRPGTYYFVNTDWTRNGAEPAQTTNHIRVDTTGATKCAVAVKGGGFMVVNGYTPSGTTRVIEYGSVTGNIHTVSWEDVVFESSVEIPTMFNGDIGPNRPCCQANFAGASVGSGLTGVNSFVNLASITKNGTGDFTLNYARARPAGGVTNIFGSVLGNGFITKVGDTASTVRFQTRDLSGVATDFNETQVCVISSNSWLG